MKRAPVKTVTVKFTRRPEQLWRRWVDHGASWTSYRLAWFYVTVER